MFDEEECRFTGDFCDASPKGPVRAGSWPGKTHSLGLSWASMISDLLRGERDEAPVFRFGGPFPDDLTSTSPDS